MELAEQFIGEITDYCKKIKIVGSLRRRKTECRDIDLVLLAKPGELWNFTLKLRKMDISRPGMLLRIHAKEARKKGLKNRSPLFIPITKLGIKDIILAWEIAEKPSDRVFPMTKWLAWKLISTVTEGRLYPHYFRMNRATRFAGDEKTSILDLKAWFAWKRTETVDSYLTAAGRTTRPMAKRLE